MMDAVMKRTTKHKEEYNGISHVNWRTWISQTKDNILAQHFKDMTEKLVDLNRVARKIGMKNNQVET
jgi:hypothetical protein